MSTSALWYLHNIRLPEGSPVDITEITDSRVAIETEPLVARASGDTAPLYSGASFTNALVTFSTPQIEALLTLIDTEGIATKYTGASKVLAYIRKGIPLGTREAPAAVVHETMSLSENLLTWNSLRADQGGVATIDVRIRPTYNGSVLPVEFTGSAALVGTVAAGELFTLGPVSINAANVDGLQSASWENNISLNEIGESGSPHITYADVGAFGPVITLRSTDASILRTFGMNGTPLTALSFYLRRRIASGVNHPNASSEHIKLTATSGTIHARELSGEQAAVELTIILTKVNATTDPFAIAVNQAIT